MGRLRPSLLRCTEVTIDQLVYLDPPFRAYVQGDRMVFAWVVVYIDP